MQHEQEKHKEQSLREEDTMENILIHNPDRHSSVFGMYLNRDQAEQAKIELVREGFSEADVSVLSPLPWGRKDFVYHQKTTIQEGAVIGGIIGSIVIGFIGLLISSDGLNRMNLTTAIGVQSGSYAWILPSIVGCAIGLIVGAAFGALVGIGIPQGAAKRYGFYLKEGALILGVKADTLALRDLAKKIFERSGAEDISNLQTSEIWKTIVKERSKMQLKSKMSDIARI